MSSADYLSLQAFTKANSPDQNSNLVTAVEGSLTAVLPDHENTFYFDL